MDEDRTGTDVLASALSRFQAQKGLADGAIAQVTEDEIRRVSADGNNSIAILIKHMAGNMHSRWTDFLTTDGEKPDRQRDQEFVDDWASHADILAAWERGWDILFDALEPLTDADLGRIVEIRGEPHSVLAAVLRQLTHYSYHVGQIVSIARALVGERWQSLSIPPGGSSAYNEKMGESFGNG